MAHAAVEGLEVAAAVAELADAAMLALERRRNVSAAEREREREVVAAEEALAKERAENQRLRSALDMYKDVLREFKAKGLLEHMEQLNGMDPDQLCERLKERVDSPEFLQKLGTMTATTTDAENTWIVVDENDENLSDEGYVVVTQDDIVDGIACYMAKYLATQPKAKDMSPEEVQKALSRAFTIKDKRGLIGRLWGAGKVLYTIASWTATAVGIYKNPMMVRAALVAIWTTISVLLRLLK